MKIVFYLKEPWEESYLREKLPEHEFEFRSGRVEDDAMESNADVLSCFMSSHVGGRELARYPQLKLIVTRSTGFDHIDLAAAQARGVVVTSVPSYGVNTVAEFAAALMLALSRRICEARRRLAEEKAYSHEGLTGFDLAGKTIGIVGTGRIGIHMANIAFGFGMRILAHDVVENTELKENYAVTYCPLDELVALADIISLHVPNLPQTRHLFNRDRFAKLKRGAYLINTARGAVVDTQALIEALDSGVLAGAGLDVLEDETASAQTLALAARPNVIVTPHVAFDTQEAKQRILDTTMENITAFAQGAPQNVVLSA